MRALSVSQISDRLRDRFTLLSWHGRTTDLRQRTLRAAMDWSYDLLDPEERAVFGQLGVFAGMLETVRQYALFRLGESGEEEAARARHRDYFLSVVASAAPELHKAAQAGHLATLEQELPNFRAALEWSRGADHVAGLAAIACGLMTFWVVRGHETEGRAWLEAAAGGAESLEPVLRAHVLHGLGALAHLHGDLAAAERALATALALRREMDDCRGEIESLNALGHLAQWSGDFECATSLHEEALGLARSLGDKPLVAHSLKHLGVDARNRGDYDASATLFRERLRHFRMIGDTREVANTPNNLGVVLAQRGELDEAAEMLSEHLELRRSLGDRRGVAASLNNLGELARMQGDQAAAARHYSEALDLSGELGDARGIAYALESLVGAALMRGHAMQALHLAGAVMALREAAGLPLAPAESEEFDRLLEEARTAVGDLDAARALDTGRSLSLEDAIARGHRLTGRLGRIG